MTDSLEDQYVELRQRFLSPVAERIQEYLETLLANEERVDRISARAKAVDRFLEKAAKTKEDGSAKYNDPIHEIQDMVGARIITFYLSDVQSIADKVCPYFKGIERKALVPDSEDKFGYEGQHFIFFIPRDVIADDECSDDDPKFFELQIKTLFQHAWGEASHDLAYKAASPLTSDQKRRVAYAAAQAWGGDRILQDIYDETVQGGQ